MTIFLQLANIWCQNESSKFMQESLGSVELSMVPMFIDLGKVNCR